MVAERSRRGRRGLRRPIIAAGKPRAVSFLSSSRVPALPHAEVGCNPTLASGIPECQLPKAFKFGGAKVPQSFPQWTLEGGVLPHPKRWGWPHNHPQTRHPPAVGGRLKHHDPGHWACSRRQSREATGFKQPCSTGAHALEQAQLWVDLWHLLLHWR